MKIPKNLIPESKSQRGVAQLVLSGLVVMSSVLVLPVHAANECAPVGTAPAENGAAADIYNCSGNFTATGITYDSAGALTVNATGTLNVGVNGVTLSGNGADAVNFTAAGTITGTSGPVIDVSSASGPINVTTAGITGTGAAVTHGISAVSTGGGSVNVRTTGTVNVTSTLATAQQQSAVRAVSSGGNGDVAVHASGNVTGRLHGIQAQASGTGALTISSGPEASTSISVSATAGIAAIDAVAGTGLLTVALQGPNSGSSVSTVRGFTGHAIRAVGQGDVLISLTRNRRVETTQNSLAVLDLSAANQITINNGGAIGAQRRAVTFITEVPYLAVRADGSAISLQNQASLTGRIDFSGITGQATLDNLATGEWNTAGISKFRPGDSVVNNAGTFRLFGATTFEGLKTFNNLRVIDFREGANLSAADTVRVLSMPGTTFTGLEDSLFVMQAMLGTAGQAGCATPTVADCLDLSGGQTSGVTSIILRSMGPITADANTDGIVLVDVSGGTSHAGDFIIDNRTVNYADDPVYGGMIRTDGWLGFALQYNAGTQQHVLSSVVPTKKLEYLAAPQGVLSVWHTTSESIVGRQADLRDRGEAGAWVRVTGGNSSRDVGVSYAAGGTGYRVDDEYSLDTTTAIGGFDLAYGQLGGGEYVFGFHAGAVRASMERKTSPTTDEIDGTTLGVYGGWWGEALTLDATINTNFLTLEQNRPASEVSSTSVQSVGLRTEAGWRLPMGESFYLQPLASVAWVKADIKRVVQTSFEVEWQGVDSLRAALGLRLGGDLMAGKAKLGYWLTARAWNESGSDTVLTLKTPVEDVTMANDLGGSFQEVGLGINVSNQKGTLNVFASGNTQFASGMDDYNFSLGARLRW